MVESIKYIVLFDKNGIIGIEFIFKYQMEEGQPLIIVLKNAFVKIKSYFCTMFLFRVFVFLFLISYFFTVFYLQLGIEWIKQIDTFLNLLGTGLFLFCFTELWKFINKIDLESLRNIFLWMSFVFLIYLEYLLLDFKKTSCKLFLNIVNK